MRTSDIVALVIIFSMYIPLLLIVIKDIIITQKEINKEEKKWKDRRDKANEKKNN